MPMQSASPETKKLAAKFLGRLMLDHAKKAGQSGDTELGHLTPGDVVIPIEKQTPEIKEGLRELFRKGNIDASRFTVGGKGNSRNPKTDLPQFMDSGVGGGGSGPGDSAGPGDNGGGGPSQGAHGMETGGGSQSAAAPGGGPGTVGAAAGPGASETAVENMSDAQAAPLTSMTAARLGVLGQFGQPNMGPFANSVLNAITPKDPLTGLINTAATIAAPIVGIPGLAVQAANMLGKQTNLGTIGSNLSEAIQGKANMIGGSANPGTVGSESVGPPGPVGGAGQAGTDDPRLAQNLGFPLASPLNISQILAQQSPSVLNPVARPAGQSLLQPSAAPPALPFTGLPPRPQTELPLGSRAVSGFQRLP